MASKRRHQFQPVVNKKGQLELDLLDADLQDFPEEILNFKELKVLKLPTNTIHSLPHSISILTELEELYLHTKGWDNLYDCEETLEARGAGLQEVPTAVTQLKRLRVLSVRGNPRIPTLLDAILSSPPPSLVELEMVACGIDMTQLPVIRSSRDVGLYKLDLSRNRRLKTFCVKRIPALNTLKVLKLNDCNLQQVPRELNELRDLEVLHMSRNSALCSFAASACAGLKKLKVLNLSGCDIRELPADLSALSELEQLDLSGNKNLISFSELPCTGLKKLKVMNLSGCNIRELPAELSALSVLEHLDLSRNKNLKSFPELACAVLKKMKVLNLSRCDIRELPADLSALSELEQLDLSGNKNLISFSELPCAGLKKLKVLNLSECNMRELQAELSALSELERLDLSRNYILKYFPELACASLKKLKVLNLSECDIRELPAELSALSELEQLDLSRNYVLKSFPELACAGLKKLKVLNLCWCDIRELPAELSALSELDQLDLSFNRMLRWLPDSLWEGRKFRRLRVSDCGLQRLPANIETKMESLDMSRNPLSHVSKKFLFSPSLKVLKLDSCPMVSPPIEVCRQGLFAMRDFFVQLERTVGVRRSRLKLLIMGTTMAGKTSLVKALLTGGPYLTDVDDRTIGVEETLFKLGDNRLCRVIDCGGQRAYMLTNQLMVSDDALALVVVDASQYKMNEECFRKDVGDYLEVLYERNSRAYVVIVVSKVDRLTTARDDIGHSFTQHFKKHLRDFNEVRQARIREMTKFLGMDSANESRSVKTKLQFLRSQRITVREEVVLTSAATTVGLDSLWSLLDRLSQDTNLLPSLRTELPESWVSVEDNLALPVQDSLPIKNVSDVIAMSVQHGLTEEGTLFLLNYLHEVGSVLYYSRQAALSDAVFPKSDFVVNAMKAIFRHDHGNLSYDHRFIGMGVSFHVFQQMKFELIHDATARIPLLLALWNDLHLTADVVDVFLRLLLSFDFAYLIASSDSDALRLSSILRSRGIGPIGKSSAHQLPATAGAAASTLVHPAASSPAADLISELKSHNVGLLLPWLLSEEVPSDVCHLWDPTCSEYAMEVGVIYSFVYNVPLGLFELLSARCHRHSCYVRHWRDGLLLCYGPVNVQFVCNRNPSSASICLLGRIPVSHNNAARLWHVLLRCVADLEDLIDSIPGVLVDRRIEGGRRSGESEHREPCQVVSIQPMAYWPPFQVETPVGRSNLRASTHVDAVRQVSDNVDRKVPLSDVLSRRSGEQVDSKQLDEIATEIGNYWPQLATVLGIDRSVIAEALQLFRDESLTALAASHVLQMWWKMRKPMVCELYDALCTVRLQKVADTQLGHLMVPDDASGLVTQHEHNVAALKVDECREVDTFVIDVVAGIGRKEWREIGRALGLAQEDLCEYERYDKLKEALFHVVYDWTRQYERVTVGQLLRACDTVGIGGAVRRKLAETSSTQN